MAEALAALVDALTDLTRELIRLARLAADEYEADAKHG